MAENQNGDLILGLDIGVASVGWALIRMTKGRPSAIEAAGVRVFESGVDEAEFEKGNRTAPGADRRMARQQRRMTWRRAFRLDTLHNALCAAGLLPHGEAADTLPGLDKALLVKHLADSSLSDDVKARLPHVLPYWLRARALDRRLDPHELGRALYHLGQRRGFLSNRKAAARKDDDEGAVKEGISELRGRMHEAKARTLGEYFAGVDPQVSRIRRHWTGRDMFLTEFEAIWTAQAAHHPALLTAELKKKVWRAIFRQRPMKSASRLVGFCEFEPQRRRAPIALLAAQRFRLLQQVNHVQITAADGRKSDLTAAQRTTLVSRLEREGDCTFAAARKLLGLPRGVRFNLEDGGEERFLGNRTNAKLAGVFGESWWGLSETQRAQVVEDVLTVEKEATLAARGVKAWGLSPEAAAKLARTSLEDGYCALSRQALARLLPHLERGKPYMTAVQAAYGERPAPVPVAELPPLDAAVPHLRNPAVHRTLAELRKVVNGVLRRYGKPDVVRVELARDLRRSAAQRKESWQRNRRNEKTRMDAARRVTAQTGETNPSRADIEKVLLFDECKGICPYTGRAISFAALFGANPQFDVEHIIPFSRSLDNSFFNKTLCYHEENRNVKGNKTPWEAYGQDPQRWQETLGRVGRFEGHAAAEKLRRFDLRELDSLDDFVDQQLNDTRYASREAVKYLAMLYGGYWDGEGRRVFATKGGVTAFLRSAWGLNGILGDPETNAKTRDDHRHHAVDALVVALTTPSAVKALSDASARAWLDRRRHWGTMPEPWPGFEQEVRARVGALNVSHRVSRQVNGKLHEDTFYGRPRKDADGRERTCVRKAIATLAAERDIDAIVDAGVRARVRAHLAACGGDFKKAFGDEKNHPFMEAGDGRRIPIHSVRVWSNVAPQQVGNGPRARFVKTGDNHHMEIVEVLRKGRPRWEGRVVTRLEAIRRQARREAVCHRPNGNGEEFKMSLASGEMVEIDHPKLRQRLLARVRWVTDGEVAFVSASDARKQKEMRDAGVLFRKPPDQLRALNCRKVVVTPLGEVRYAND